MTEINDFVSRNKGEKALSVKLMSLLISEAYQLIYSVNVSTWVLLIGRNFSQSLEFEEGKESIVEFKKFFKFCQLVSIFYVLLIEYLNACISSFVQTFMQ